MDYGKPSLADRLAAEYVLGTLRGPARRRFENLLLAHPRLRDAVTAWQAHLNPLALGLPEQVPSPAVWRAIQARLDGRSAVVSHSTVSRSSSASASQGPASAPAPAAGGVRSGRGGRAPTSGDTGGFWASLGFWRGFSAFATVATLAFGLLLANPSPTAPPVVVVLSAAGGAPGAGFVASVSGDGRAMVTRPIMNVNLQADRALELWSIPPEAGAAPRSLGLISQNGSTVVSRGRVLDNTAAFAVSLEPAGGSPTGLPTGPVLYVGKLTS